ncbi:MAG TPA: BTAD domain-containing putative transcriptional regulator [Baekduia sp.]|nr:BTAD domain-containing putative transcriptional regulator [Baekduia sp.]
MSTRELATNRGRDEGKGGWLGLVSLIATCVAVAVGLWAVTGPPSMLASTPDWSHIQTVLTGSRLSDQDVITVTTGIAWLVITYLLLSIVVRLAFGLAAVLTDQAAWARGGLRVTAPLTLPIVRRVVDGALAGTILFSATFHTPSAAFAAAAPITTSVEAPLQRHLASFTEPATVPSTAAPALAAETVPATYTVTGGDHLWGIAERFLGDGFRWVEIWKLNQQRTMTDGRTFVDPNLIYPGWQLELPQDVSNVEPESIPGEEGIGGTPEPDPTPEPSPVPPTPDPTREPSPVPPTPEPTAVVPTPTPTVIPGGPVAPADEGGGGPELRPSLPSVPTPGGGVAAAAAAITVGGAAMLLVFRRARHRAGQTNGRPERRPAGSGDAARVLATSTALGSAMSELDFTDTEIVVVRESDRYLEFTLDCPPGDAEALLASRYALGRQLGCAVDGELLASTAVRLKLSRMNQLAAAMLADAVGGDRPLLVPVGASDSGIHYLNLAAVGSVLVVGGRLEGRDLLTSWFATIDSLHPEGTVTAVADGAAEGPLGDCLELLPGAADAGPPADSPSAFAQWLETALLAREADREASALLALLGSNPEPVSAFAEMEGILRQGPGRGIFVIAFAELVEAVDIGHSFGASVVLGEGEQSGGPGPITLTLPHLPPFHLEPVMVRRQVAHRPRGNTAAPVPATPESATSSAPHNGHAPSETWPENEDEPSGAGNGSIGTTDLAAPPSPNGTHPKHAVPVIQKSDATPPRSSDRQASLPLDGPEGESDSEDGPVFRARLFGTFRVETEAGEVEGWSIQKARELLAYLLAHGGTPVLRDTAAEALGLSGENQGGHPLPNAAYYVRRTLSRAVPDLEGEILVAARQRYTLRAGLFRTDVDAFDAHLARAERLQGYEALVEYQRALEICQADFLADEEYEWADAYRRDYQKRFITAARRATKLACDLRDLKLALRFNDAILQRDSIDEDAVREAMRCHTAMGDQNSAKRLYRRLIEDLREALDDEQAEPMPETTRLLDELVRPPELRAR